MKVLMVGVSEKNRGGMWTVVNNYLTDNKFKKNTNLIYIPTVTKACFVTKAFFSLNAINKVRIKLKNDHYDIIHIHMSERGSVYRTAIIEKIARKYNTKIVIHMHGAEFQTWYNSLNTKKRKFVKNTLDMADKILILGEYWRNYISGLVMSPEKIEVLYNSVSVPKKYKYNDESKNILFLGLVGKRKGIFDIIESVKQLKDKGLDFKILVYGPDETEGFTQIVKSRGLSKFIEYKGWLTDNEKLSVFSDIKANLLPSYNEGLPMTILETMSYGIPNISTPIAAIPEVVNKKNGFIVEPGNINEISKAISDVIENSQKDKSELSYQTIKNNFSLEAHTERLLNIYRNILEEK